MSYTALRKRFVTGARVRVTNNHFPHLSGVRSVVKAQTNGIYTGPAMKSDGTVVEKCWCHWPKAGEVRAEGNAIHFLYPDGSIAFTYELLEDR